MAATPGRPIQVGPRTFDEAKLAAMVEPIKIRVDRLKGHQRTPIPLPESLAGEGPWTRDEIRDHLETFLVNHWTGGGLYEIALTDSSENPITMKWQPFWPPNDYPERVPPPLEGARSPDAPPIAPPSTPYPTGARMPPLFTPPPPQQFYSYPMPPPPPVGTPQYGAWSAEAEVRRLREENERRREEADRRDREAREEKHKADLERERTTNNQRFAQLEDKLVALVRELKDTSAAPKGPSQAELDMQRQIAELKEQSRRAEERAEAARREQEADRRETLLRDQMRQMQEDTKRQIEATQRQVENSQREFQAMITNLTTQLTANSNKSDPWIQLMQDNTRQHADVLKALAQESRESLVRLQAFMMNPMDLIKMARDSQTGVSEAVERATRFTDNIVNMQQKIMENALQMQPQGNGVIDAVTQGMNNVKEFFERFVTGKSKEAIAQAQANAEIARAQAHAFEVNARVTNPHAFAPPVGLAGPSDPAFVPPPPTTQEAAPTPATKPPSRVERLWGRTDEEWFGSPDVLEEVLRLRAGAAEFQAAVDHYEQTGKGPATVEQIPGTHPQHAARVVRMAVAVIQQRQLIVPAIIELLMTGKLAEFTTLLLPDATTKYRDAVIAALQADDAEDDRDDGSDDGEEDSDGDEAPNEAVQPPPAPTARPQRRKNARN